MLEVNWDSIRMIYRLITVRKSLKQGTLKFGGTSLLLLVF